MAEPLSKEDSEQRLYRDPIQNPRREPERRLPADEGRRGRQIPLREETAPSSPPTKDNQRQSVLDARQQATSQQASTYYDERHRTIDQERQAEYTRQYDDYSSLNQESSRQKRRRRRAEEKEEKELQRLTKRQEQQMIRDMRQGRQAGRSSKTVIRGESHEKTTLMDRIRALRISAIPLGFLLFAYLWIQLIFGLISIGALGFWVAEQNWLVSIATTVVNGVLDFVGYTPIRPEFFFAVGMITSFAVGLVSYMTIGVIYYMTGINWLYGRAGALKMALFILAFPFYFFPFTNLFPWVLFSMLLAIMYPK